MKKASIGNNVLIFAQMVQSMAGGMRDFIAVYMLQSLHQN
jgi:hypothetical protein